MKRGYGKLSDESNGEFEASSRFHFLSHSYHDIISDLYENSFRS